jgi:hypothetical protein
MRRSRRPAGAAAQAHTPPRRPPPAVRPCRPTRLRRGVVMTRGPVTSSAALNKPCHRVGDHHEKQEDIRKPRQEFCGPNPFCVCDTDGDDQRPDQVTTDSLVPKNGHARQATPPRPWLAARLDRATASGTHEARVVAASYLCVTTLATNPHGCWDRGLTVRFMIGQSGRALTGSTTSTRRPPPLDDAGRLAAALLHRPPARPTACTSSPQKQSGLYAFGGCTFRARRLHGHGQSCATEAPHTSQIAACGGGRRRGG